MHFKLLVKRLFFELIFWTLCPLPFFFYFLRSIRTNRWSGNYLAQLLLLRRQSYDRVFNKWKFDRKP
ncbi:hypothetical protein QE357_002682 [Siphonobacter sp. BAB-5404]|nr:hypothetical protein [Siphonobacter sp. SORGH_AS_0500]